jgi:hypothetical protein
VHEQSHSVGVYGSEYQGVRLRDRDRRRAGGVERSDVRAESIIAATADASDVHRID